MNQPPAQTERIRVLIVDDHEMVRSGLAAFLLTAPDMESVGEAGDGSEAIRCCEQLHPDVVLMDMMMPGIDGVEATRAIHERWPDIRVIALTSFVDDDLVKRVLQAGAMSYLLKNVAAADLATAIRGAMGGRPTLAPEAAQALISQATRPTETGHDLSPRERDVLALMKRGLSNRAIADELIISRSTVDFHVSNILGKLGVSSRTEAVAFAIQHGLVE
ncbi:MAG TPA: response regulator transcription factor [Nitrolancea sp.]|nr:response regulator transcription factor [Nitrolancea sp.]